MYKKILVAVDGSDLSFKALEHAEALAKATEGELLLLTVNDNTAHSTQHKRIGLFEEFSDSTGNVQIFNDILNVMVGSPVKYKLRSENGSPAQLIIKVAEETACDTIVMGSRGLGSLTKLFVGSVSSEVINKAQIPVVIVK
ncbi:MAG: universal stress protein [Phascolarctobacterium sp.]|nr:universal stress protein [Phascolarctobacterium sp.]